MDDERLTCIGLAFEGFGGGDPDVVGEMDVESVLDGAEFMKFRAEYRDAQVEIMRAKKEGS